MWFQLGRHVERQAFQRELHGLRKRIASGAQKVVFRDFDDEAATPPDHQRRHMLGRDDVRQDRLAKHGFAVVQVRFPERVPLRHHRLFAGDAVDQHVEAAVIAIDARDQRLDLRLDRMIDANGARRPARGGDHVGGLVDCF